MSTATDQRTKLSPPGQGASVEQNKKFLEYQLDGIRRRVVLGTLMFMDGAGNRAQGGVPLVCAAVASCLQSARSCKHRVDVLGVSRQCAHAG